MEEEDNNIVDAEAFVHEDLLNANAQSIEDAHTNDSASTSSPTPYPPGELADKLHHMLGIATMPTEPSHVTAIPDPSVAPPCGHDDCLFPTYSALHASFASMEKSARVQIVRSMLLATATPRLQHNALLACTPAQWRAQSGKRRRSVSYNASDTRSSILYTCRGRQLCRLAFAHLFSLNEKTVELYFLVAGHTKNVCDGAFGHVKRELSHTNALCPRDMMRVIRESSKTTSCIAGKQVYWRKWKVFLGQFFRVPAGLRISKYHVFTARKDKPGILFVRKFQGSAETEEFGMFKPPRRSATTEVQPQGIQSDLFALTCTPLDETPSAQHDNSKKYLQVNVLQRYFQSDSNLGALYFGDGTEQVEQ